MPDWTEPFHLPQISDKTFREKQKAYVKKYGYRYSIPGFDDVFHLGFEKPITDTEQDIWKRKAYKELPEGRYEELKYLKEKKRNQYLNMLGSPQPEIFQNRGSLIGSIDDAQDAMSVAACLGAVAAKTLPKVLSKAILGPVGWIAGAAELLNLAMEYIIPERRLIQRKRIQDELTDDNPWSKKARLKRAKNLSKAHIGYGKLLEAGQVAKDVFGYGISLGAVMNLPLDIITGAARRAMGQKVEVKYPIPDINIWQKRIMKGLKALVLNQNMDPSPRLEEHSAELVLANLGPQLIQSYTTGWQPPDEAVDSRLDEVLELEVPGWHPYDYAHVPMNYKLEKLRTPGWHPIDNIQDIAMVESEAPRPTNVLTLEVIEEEDPDGINAIGWPTTGQRWSTMYDIIDTTSQPMTKKFQEYCDMMKHRWKGFVAAGNATDSLFHFIYCLEVRGNLEYDYTTVCKVLHSLLNANYRFPDDLEYRKRRCFADFIKSYSDQDLCPSVYDCILYVKAHCGFEFIVGPH